ncbi:MAG TPA: WhiB family transcriptional regulator [Pseudonocardiaceae bacterium]
MLTSRQVSAADWRSLGACGAEDPERLFVKGKAQRQAKVVCTRCPVRVQCLAEALDRRIEFGVWGGMTERERRALLLRRSDVPSWAELLTAAESDRGSVAAGHRPRRGGHQPAEVAQPRQVVNIEG